MVRSLVRSSGVLRTVFWIADPRPTDYGMLRSIATANQVDLRFLATARDVLRAWSTAAPDTFMANVQLPDMSGLDLVDMLRPFPSGVTVCIVGNAYAAEDEVRALSLGVHHYICKPVDGAMLAAFHYGNKLKTSTCAEFSSLPQLKTSFH